MTHRHGGAPGSNPPKTNKNYNGDKKYVTTTRINPNTGKLETVKIPAKEWVRTP